MKYIKKEWPLLVWCFLVFSFFGWLYELGWELRLGHGFVNKNDFNGFYLPIYGFGGLLMIFSLKDIMKKKVRIWKISITPIAVFIAAMIISTVVEYVVSCVIEDLYNIRLWDYSTTPYNLNGRIALKNSVIFGIMGVFAMYVVMPIINWFLNKRGRRFAKISAVTILALIALDIILVKVFGLKFI